MFVGWRLFASRLRTAACEAKQGLAIVGEPRRYLCRSRCYREARAQQALLVGVLGGMAAASVLAFGVGAQVATAILDVVLAVLSLALLTGSLRVRRLLAAAPGIP